MLFRVYGAAVNPRDSDVLPAAHIRCIRDGTGCLFSGTETAPHAQDGRTEKAAYQQRIAALREKVRRIEKREAETDRRARTHRLVVSGAIVEDLLPKFQNTAFANAFIAAVREHIKAHPEDRDSFAELLDKLTAQADQREAAE